MNICIVDYHSSTQVIFRFFTKLVLTMEAAWDYREAVYGSEKIHKEWNKMKAINDHTHGRLNNASVRSENKVRYGQQPVFLVRELQIDGRYMTDTFPRILKTNENDAWNELHMWIGVMFLPFFQSWMAHQHYFII